LNIFLSMVIGLVLAVSIIFLLDQFDNRIRSSDAFEQKLGMHYLGTISKMKGKNSGDKLIGLHNSQFGTAIYYKMILDKLGFSEEGGQPVRSLLVTSSNLKEGKTTTASNLGIMMARAGFNTVIVDVDWKDPNLHSLFKLSNEHGLMDLLANSDLAPKELVSSTDISRLKILTIGNLPEDPIDALKPTRVKKILSELTKTSDIVILDAPSTNIAENFTLYSLVDGVVLVIESGRTTIKSAKQAVASLHFSGGKLLGGILNRSTSPWSA